MCESSGSFRDRPGQGAAIFGILLLTSITVSAQTLINVDFGVGRQSPKSGFAAIGQATNDFWNLYRHYDPKFVPGMALVSDGTLANLKFADGADSKISISVTNAPGVWGNATGDPMYDTYIFAQNGSNIVVTISGLEAARYHFYLYGHADPDVTGEQNSAFSLTSGTNSLGPLTTSGSSGWKAMSPWQERYQYVVFRDVAVEANQPVVIEVAAGPNGIPVLNGMQIISRGTSPPRMIPALAALAPNTLTNLIYKNVRYEGRVTDTEARFAVTLDVESLATNEVSGLLFEGDVALIAPEIPEGVRIVSAARKYRLIATKPGSYTLHFDLVTRITKAEPWNQISFLGPAAAIASVDASANSGVQMQLLSGTQANNDEKTVSRVQGFLGAERTVALRWQSKTTEIARKSLVTVETLANANVTPTVIKYTTQLKYEILQAGLPKLSVVVPAGHTVTRIQGEQIRDWNLTPDGDRQLLNVEFIKPIEKSYSLTLSTEQNLEGAAATRQLQAPQPLNVERESGSLNVSADDMLVDIDSAIGLRQVNAAKGLVASFRFYGRPFTLAAGLRRIEPVVKVFDRIAARLEETRLLLSHRLNVTVEKAGIYTLDLVPQPGFNVADVTGQGVEDWKSTDGVLKISFSSKVLGTRSLQVQLEQAQSTFLQQFTILPLRAPAATNQTVEIGAGSALGIRLKTAGELVGLREMPIHALQGRSDELLAFKSEQPDWQLTIAAERLPARIVAEVFNLVTIGDGLVGGSATVRYGLVNQGVQDFRVRIPAHWKNVEFTGPNIRRKELIADAADTNAATWAITLQDKAWGGYTLVITYDYQFDPKSAALDLRGAHALNVERETGSVAVTTAASLKLEPRIINEPLRVIDPTELSETDRALITRPVLLAYKYTGEAFQLALDVTRHREVPVLDAVADRTQITSVVTEEGQMLTQASFMVKNNDKQYQKFRLPPGAKLWGCYVNNQPVKGELDGDWLAVSLPRGANRNEAFAVDIVYAQKFESLQASAIPRTVQLSAPNTDVPNTYAEWQVYVPPTRRLGGFGGSMNVARGSTYNLRDAWRDFVAFYAHVMREGGKTIIAIGVLVGIVVLAIGNMRKRGWTGALTVLGVVFVVSIMAAMLWPGVSRRARLESASSSSESAMVQLEDQTYSEPQDRAAGPAQVPAMAQTDSGVLVNGNRSFADSFSSSGRAPARSTNGYFFGVAGGAFAAEQPASITAPAAPTVAGIRSIRIEIPRAGHAFTFTKVLNVSDEPLSVRMSVMKQKWFVFWRSALQSSAFLIGLALVWFQWHRTPRNSLWLAVGLALCIGSVTSLLIAMRLLHLILIAGVPTTLLLLLIWLFWKFWPRGAAAAPAFAQNPEPEAPGPSAPPAIAGLVLALSLGIATSASGASRAKISGPDATNAFSIVSAQYTGTVQERAAQFDVNVLVSTFATNQIVPLFGDDVAIQEFSTKASDAKLLRDGKAVNIRLGSEGDALLHFKLIVKLGGDVTRRQLAFGIPAALSSKVAVGIDEPDADLDFPTAVSFKRTPGKNQTQVDAILGSGDRVEMYWTPRVKRINEMAASIFVQNHSLVTVGGGVINTRSFLDYQISQGELRQAKVQIPAGQRLLRVEGEWIRTWEISDEGKSQMLTVDLVKGVAPGYRLVVETEKVLERLPAQVTVAVPQVQNVIRETGTVGIRGGEELTLTIDNAPDLQRIDATEFAKNYPEKIADIVSAYRFLKSGLQLTARAEPVAPQIEAVVRNSFRIGFEQLILAAKIDYTIKKAGVFTLRFNIPADYKVDSVLSGTNALSWLEKEARLIEVTLPERTVGSYAVAVNLSRTYKDPPKTLELAGVQPLDVQKFTGYVSVTTEQGIAVKTSSFAGIVEIPASTLGEGARVGNPVLAFKHLSADAQNAAWKLVLSTEAIDSWIRAEVVHIFSVSETLLSGRAVIRYDIQNAPAKEFRLNIPSRYRNVEIVGTNIRRRDQTNEEWRVELQNKVRGAFTLTVTFEEPLGKTNGPIEVIGVSALGVERETGQVVLMTKPPLQLVEKSVTDQILRIDPREVPDWAGLGSSSSASGTEAPVLVYRYLRPGFRVAFEMQRFQDAAVLQALVDSAQLTTVVADDGQMMTEMALSIRNNGLQHLEIELPAKTRVWSAFVGGQAVRPAERNGKLLLPLDRSSQDAAVPIELTYVGTERFPKNKGQVALLSPRLDVPLKNARWEIYLPPDYEYSKFAGTMMHEAGIEPTVRAYSSTVYQKQEQAKEDARKSGLNTSLFRAKKLISSGKLKDADEDLKQAQINAPADEKSRNELEGLKRELDKARSSNLIEAQRAYTIENTRRYRAQSRDGAEQLVEALEQKAGELVAYDAEAAERQWDVLQKAQAVTVANVQPLRVNLPTRGLRHSFTQVLQTEVNKPMTIEFRAADARETGWFKILLNGVGAFLLLWIFSATVLKRSENTATA